ncbi:MAG: ComF family protein [Thermoanaerobaculia bacterium]
MRPLLDLLDLLWPRHCLACGALVQSGDGLAATLVGAPPLGLCGACHRRLVRLDPLASCRTCARPLAPALPGPALQRCGVCLADPPAFERLTPLWRYETPLKEVVHALKFGRLDYLGAHFARALGQEFARRRSEAEWRPPDLVVPVPLPWPRRLARGFNQTELVAGPLARELGRPCPRALVRRFFAPRQTGQGRGGRSRAAHFEVRDPAAVKGRSILLVDDVLTTGATVRGASAALRRAGAGAIEVAVVGWTPLDGPRLPLAGRPGG